MLFFVVIGCKLRRSSVVYASETDMFQKCSLQVIEINFLLDIKIPACFAVSERSSLS